MTLLTSHTIIGAPVDRRRYLIRRPRPCFAHRPDYSSVFRPNTIAQSISDQYVIVLYPLTERAMIKWYLADMRIHWVLHEIYITTTQIDQGFYIYTLERSFCLIVSIIINIRYTSRGPMGLCSHSGLYQLRWIHWVLYDKHTITTEIRSGYYIYILERSFCLMINIMIDIRYISRCVIQISKSVQFILHVLSSDYSFSSVHVKNLSPTAPKKTRGPDVASSVSRLIFMRCHDNVQSVTPQSSPECRTDTTIGAGTVYTPNVTNAPQKSAFNTNS